MRHTDSGEGQAGMRIFGLAVLGLALGACDPDLTFKHPVTGDVRVCKGAAQHGFVSMVQNSENARCQDEAWKAGYERVMK
jgi:hypothetical protein